MKIKKLQNLQLINHWSIIISSKTFSQVKIILFVSKNIRASRSIHEIEAVQLWAVCLLNLLAMNPSPQISAAISLQLSPLSPASLSGWDWLGVVLAYTSVL
jgi:hypothetical protein